MDMKITKLCEYLKKEWYHHTKHNHISSDIKCLVYQAWKEKTVSMSKRRFCEYLERYGIGRWTVRNIISQWEQLEGDWKEVLMKETRDSEKKDEYSKRYHHTSRKKTIDEYSKKQKGYIIEFRYNNPNAWYKRFYNKHLQPWYLDEYKKIFKSDAIMSKELYYQILEDAWVDKRITKRKKRRYIQEQYVKYWWIEAYCNKMRYVYMSERALHKRQVDIKYLIDIPNMLTSEIAFLYPYQITFRDFRSWAVIKFFWHNRDVSRVMVATKVFESIMTQAWLDMKNIMLQFDWWAEFSTVKINWSEGKYFEYLKATFKWYTIIDRKEQNGHVEAYHRICEDDFMDTPSSIEWMKWKWKDEKKLIFLERAHEYVKTHNKYRYSSYLPRYKTFWKKSPLQIIKEDRWQKINHHILENYLWAYDVDWWIRLPQKNTYKILINAIINSNILEVSYPYNVRPTEKKIGGQLWAGLYISNTR